MINDNQQLNKPKNISLFKDNPDLVYIYRKTEKLISAVYLLSNFISDKEPLKWQLRESGLELIKFSFSASKDFIITAFRLASFLETAYIAGIVSTMNYEILKKEFESLIQAVESGERSPVAKGLIFPDHFFEIPLNQETSPVSYKGQNTMSDRMSVMKTPPKTKLKSNRQDIIIGLLTKNQELGIKDFTAQIADCSEKTIQRELVSMASKGLIRKEGEKRWSRYSLR